MESVKLKTAHYITCDDVEKLTGKYWGFFEFAYMAENDAYQILDCSDWYLEELYEEFEDVKDEIDFDENDKNVSHYHKRDCYAYRLKNQIELVEILRKQFGVRDSILIWISW